MPAQNDGYESGCYPPASQSRMAPASPAPSEPNQAAVAKGQPGGHRGASQPASRRNTEAAKEEPREHEEGNGIKKSSKDRELRSQHKTSVTAEPQVPPPPDVPEKPFPMTEEPQDSRSQQYSSTKLRNPNPENTSKRQRSASQSTDSSSLYASVDNLDLDDQSQSRESNNNDYAIDASQVNRTVDHGEQRRQRVELHNSLSTADALLAAGTGTTGAPIHDQHASYPSSRSGKLQQQGDLASVRSDSMKPSSSSSHQPKTEPTLPPRPTATFTRDEDEHTSPDAGSLPDPELAGGAYTEVDHAHSGDPGLYPSLEDTSKPSGWNPLGYLRAGPLAPAPPRDKTKEELYRTRDELKKSQYDFKRSQSDLQRVRYELENHKAELQRMYSENRSAQRQMHSLQTENHRLRDTAQSLQHELNNVQRKFEDAKALSDVRGKELQGAQVFLTKADSLAVSDLVQSVDGLNQEIFQAAASLGESVCKKKWEVPEEEAMRCAADTQMIIGGPLLSIIQSEAQKAEEAVHPFVVQVVLQVFLTAFCAEKIKLWAPEHDDYIQSLYKAIWFQEEQAVSGRWRALTRAHTRLDASAWSKDLLGSLNKLMISASWDMTTPEKSQGIDNQLAPIFRNILDVRIALGEKFTSADIEVATFEPGLQYFKHHMDDAYADERRGGGNKGSENILATAGMGLKKAIRGSDQYEKVLAPKVVLESTMKGALEPAPSRSKGKKRERDSERDGKGGVLGAISSLVS